MLGFLIGRSPTKWIAECRVAVMHKWTEVLGLYGGGILHGLALLSTWKLINGKESRRGLDPARNLAASSVKRDRGG